MSDDGQTPQEDGEKTSEGGAGVAYRAVVLTVGTFGVLAVVIGLAGTFVVLTGSTDTPDHEAEVFGDFACETFDGDPQVVHDADYEVERTVLNPIEVASFDGTVGEDGSVTVELEPNGSFLDASANERDATPITVETHDDGVVVERNTTEPFRLWVDTIADGSTVTRMQLDICPPP